MFQEELQTEQPREEELEQGTTQLTSNPREKLHLAFDEACSHLNVKHFRLIMNMYDGAGQVLLGTGVSPPIKCVANNDVKGAPYIPISITVPSTWDGWRGIKLDTDGVDDSVQTQGGGPPSHSMDSNPTDVDLWKIFSASQLNKLCRK